MASYEDKYENTRLDWALPLQRTGDFPLDRSSMFSTYEDAVKYAKGDITDPDIRELCETSYVGQIITVFENDVVTPYKINADRTLSPLGSSDVDIDEKSIGKNSNNELELKGYETAEDGKMPVKSEEGFDWETPASVEEVERIKTDCNNIKVDCVLAKVSCDDTKEKVERKIWFGSISEYNALETIYTDTIYIILDGALMIYE